MKVKILVLSILAAVLFSCGEGINTEKEASLLELLNNEQLFKLREVYEANTERISNLVDLRIQASLLNTFNKNEESNQAVDQLLSEFNMELTDSLKTDLIFLKTDNFLKLFEYKEAFETNNIIINDFKHSLDSTSYAEALNMSNIYEPLINTPPQKVEINGDNFIPLSRDVVGLMNVNVRFGQSNYDLIFDTGAGLSVLKRSFAEEIGLDILDTTIEGYAATGKVIKTSLAVSDSLFIGDILVTNCVFLVLEDEELNFPQANFFPLGIIGFPVIEEMKEISITKTDTLIVNMKQSTGVVSNMRLKGLEPLVYLFNGNDTLSYSFDTGATHTHFTSRYFEKNKDFLSQNAIQDTVSTASAGGRTENTTYRLESTELYIGKEKAILKNIHVRLDHNETFKSVYGNLGQDLIRQFDILTLNFDEMFLLFK